MILESNNRLFVLTQLYPDVPEEKTYPGAERILTSPTTPEPLLIDEDVIGRQNQQYAE